MGVGGTTQLNCGGCPKMKLAQSSQNPHGNSIRRRQNLEKLVVGHNQSYEPPRKRLSGDCTSRSLSSRSAFRQRSRGQCAAWKRRKASLNRERKRKSSCMTWLWILPAGRLHQDGACVQPVSVPLRREAGVPEVQFHHVIAGPTAISRTKQVVQKVWAAIQTGHYYPNPSPLNCPTCPYQRECRAWTG